MLKFSCDHFGIAPRETVLKFRYFILLRDLYTRENKFTLGSESVHRGDVVVTKIASIDNLVDPFTKSLPAKTFDSHLKGMRFRYITTWL